MIVNVWTFLFEVLNFLALVYVLRRLLYRPLQQAIDSRRQANAKAQADAELARREAAALKQQLSERLAALDRERQALLRQARDQAEAEAKKTAADAELAIKSRRKEVDEQLERERALALDTLRAQLVDSAVALAGRVLKEAADSTLHYRLAARLVEELERTPDDVRERMRAEWGADDRASVDSAAELNGDVLQNINNALTALAGRTVELTVQPDPALIAGVRLRLGGHVWDASLLGGLGPDAAVPAGSVAS